MMLPSSVTICEVGPREGMQIEKGPISTASKVRLIDMLSDARLPKIDVTSFVNAAWVPQMADAEEVVRQIRIAPGTDYTGLYLNSKGLLRALATGILRLEGWVLVSASEIFARKNNNSTPEELYQAASRQIDLYRAHGMGVDQVVVMAAFGCNYGGDIAPDKVLKVIERAFQVASEHGANPPDLTLADSMGWCTPHAMQRLLGDIRARWPEKNIRLHLHDTRGLALASAWVGLQNGVRHYETSVGGLGGCPFGNFSGASGNMVTEDFVHMCHEAGIETGVDLNALIEASRYAEEIVGHPLPGKLLRGNSLHTYRKAAAVETHV